jgi:hypothetical protein
MAVILTTETLAPEETEDLGAELAAKLSPNEVVALYGSLGTGKTCFVKGMGKPGYGENLFCKRNGAGIRRFPTR